MVTFDPLMLPLMKAPFNLGGSGSVDEIYEAVIELEINDKEFKISDIRYIIKESGREVLQIANKILPNKEIFVVNDPNKN